LGQVIDPVERRQTAGWKGIASNKNSLGQFSASASDHLVLARRTFTRHRLV
jgi:hypothetical protein